MRLTIPVPRQDKRMTCTKFEPRFLEEKSAEKFIVSVGPVPHTIKDAAILKEFSVFGRIVDMRRPLLLSKRHPSSHLFIEYEDANAMNDAIVQMNGRLLWNSVLEVRDTSHNEVIFSNETGFLTNMEVPMRQDQEDNFDSSMPAEHYAMRRREKLRNTDNVYSIRVDGLPPKIQKEHLEEMFGDAGEVSSVYLPVRISSEGHISTRDFCFVRYTRKQSVEQAIQMFNGMVFSPEYPPLRVTVSEEKTYFSLDESTPNQGKRRAAN